VINKKNKWFNSTSPRQAGDGVWKKQEDFSSPSAKRGGEDFRKGHADFDLPTSPPLSLSDMGGGGGGGGGGLNSLANWSLHTSHSHGYGVPPGASHRESHHPPVPHKGRALEELERRSSSEKASSVEVRLVSKGPAFGRGWCLVLLWPGHYGLHPRRRRQTFYQHRHPHSYHHRRHYRFYFSESTLLAIIIIIIIMLFIEVFIVAILISHPFFYLILMRLMIITCIIAFHSKHFKSTVLYLY
jgi:hypothetical protein